MKGLKRLLALLLSIVILATAIFAVSYFTGYKIYRDVSYGEKSANVMDIYIPSDARGRKSDGCILFIHGGSWAGGDKAEEEARCRLYASRGYVVATMNYTLWSEQTSSDYSVFDVLDEIDLALIKIKEFAAERGVTLDKAATSGYSAGAHLALLYAYSHSSSAPMEIVFTSGMAGPTEISPEIWGEDMTLIIGERLSGEKITADMLRDGSADGLLSSVSPTSYITPDSAPTLIVHGDKDTTVPPANVDALTTKLDKNGVKYDCVYLEDSDHSLMQNPVGHLKYYKTLLDYCKTHFGH